jgi:hypothetical protein
VLHAAVVLLLAASCGSGDSGGPDETATASTDGTAVSTPTAAGAGGTATLPPETTHAGTREDPVPLGEAASLVDGWTLAVTAVTPDATELVVGHNEFNDPPATGEQYFMVALTATSGGSGSAGLEGSFRFRLVGDSAVTYSTFENDCGVIPDEISKADVFQGGTLSGNLCWAVKSSDVGSLVMFDDPVNAEDEDRVFFALR